MKKQQDWIAGAPPDPEPLRSVSPSQIGLLWRCALSALWSSQLVPRALPQNPAGRLGIVAHRLLEQAGIELLTNPSVEDIEARWEQLVRATHASMEERWLEQHLVPLASSVADYEVRRIRSIRLALKVAQTTPRTQRIRQPGRVGSYEVPVSTPDGEGYRKDRRTGQQSERYCCPRLQVRRNLQKNLSGQLTTKPEYVTQLRPYAAVVAAMKGKWPARLEIISLDGSTEEVSFSEDDCATLLREAGELLDTANAIVNSSENARDRINRLARPSDTACRFFSYRPICPAYLECSGGDADIWPRDMHGVVRDVRKLGNGRILIELKVADSDTPARVVGLDPSISRHVGDQRKSPESIIEIPHPGLCCSV